MIAGTDILCHDDLDLSLRLRPLNEAHVELLASILDSGGELLLPVVSCVDGVNYLVDGFHTFAALERARGEGVSTTCRVHTETMEDALWRSAMSNRHGLSRGEDTLREQCRRALQTARGRALTQAELAAAVGCSVRTVKYAAAAERGNVAPSPIPSEIQEVGLADPASTLTPLQKIIFEHETAHPESSLQETAKHIGCGVRSVSRTREAVAKVTGVRIAVPDEPAKSRQPVDPEAAAERALQRLNDDAFERVVAAERERRAGDDDAPVESVTRARLRVVQ